GDGPNARAQALVPSFSLPEFVVTELPDNSKIALDCALEIYFLRRLRIRHGGENSVEGRVRPAAVNYNPIGAPNRLHACASILGRGRVLRKKNIQASDVFMASQERQHGVVRIKQKALVGSDCCNTMQQPKFSIGRHNSNFSSGSLDLGDSDCGFDGPIVTQQRSQGYAEERNHDRLGSPSALWHFYEAD